jgi:hypothetical protein
VDLDTRAADRALLAALVGGTVRESLVAEPGPA